MTTVQKPMPFAEMPSEDEMYRALCQRDSEFEGVFFFSVRTTGIFCRPTCTARQPKRENVGFHRTAGDALAAGFRACKKCKPLEVFGAAPDWLRHLLDAVEDDPSKRWRDDDLRKLSVEPARVRRWFKRHHGITFHAYLRTRRLATAMGQIQVGQNVTRAGMSNGFDSVSGFREAFKKYFGSSPAATKSGDVIKVNRILTSLGPMIAAANERELILLEFADRRMLATQIKTVTRRFDSPFFPGENEILRQTETQLTEYFAAKRSVFDLPLAIRGTKFQAEVWNQLLQIPHGETRSYDQIANAIERQGAQRAVGKANGDNRIAIVVPCHRVIRSDGTLSGYGGQLWRKKWLLDHERRASQRHFMSRPVE